MTNTDVRGNVRVLNLPNSLTIARIVIIPLFTIAVIYKRYDYALYMFIVAALTDALDGFIARLTNQKTEFGTFLDPLGGQISSCYVIYPFFAKRLGA